jgi:hypothetical protein
MKAKGLTIAIIYTNNAREFLKIENKLYFNSNSIKVVISLLYNATRNSITKHANSITEN